MSNDNIINTKLDQSLNQLTQVLTILKGVHLCEDCKKKMQLAKNRRFVPAPTGTNQDQLPFDLHFRKEDDYY